MIRSILKWLLQLFNLEYRYGKIIPAKHDTVRYHKKVVDLAEGNRLISYGINENKSLLVARIGDTELYLTLHYLHYKNRKKVDWLDYHREIICQQSGIFPGNDASLKKFIEAYLNAIAQTDIIGVWNNRGEDEVIRRYNPGAVLIPLESIEPYFFDDPWSQYLVNKKVLVIHPFEQSIQQQYHNKRKFLFKNSKVLPLFQLETIKAVQAHVFNETPYKSWEDILKYMQEEITKKDFDVAIIGAGGYGLLLGAFVKSMGKKAIHMGGATQIMFGIKGKRWEAKPEFKNLFNESWKNPYPEERPEKAVLLEGGAYW